MLFLVDLFMSWRSWSFMQWNWDGERRNCSHAPFQSKTMGLRVWAMAVAIQAPEMDAVCCQALHILEKLFFCPVELEWRKKELLPCPFLVKNNGFQSMGDDSSYTGTRNGHCSLPSSSYLGEVGFCAVELEWRKKELLPCPFQ